MPECTTNCKQFVVNDDTDNECLHFEDAIVDISWEIRNDCPHFEDRLKAQILAYIKEKRAVAEATIIRKFSDQARGRLIELLNEARIYYITMKTVGYLGEGVIGAE